MVEKLKLSTLALLWLCLLDPLRGLADTGPHFYGKFDVGLLYTDDDVEPEPALELVSNSSRVGVRGEVPVTPALSAIYQLEYLVNIDDGEEDGRTIGQRDTYLGLTGSWGRVIGGTHDNPTKLILADVDRFGDLAGDVSTMVNSEDRDADIVMYQSPLLSRWHVATAVILGERESDDGYSASAAYQGRQWYFAASTNQRVENGSIDVYRGVAEYSRGGWRFGAMWELEDVRGNGADEAWLVSADRLWGDFIIKGQFGSSNIQTREERLLTLGIDYLPVPNVVFYAFTAINANAEGEKIDDNDIYYASIGIDVTF